MLNRNGQVEKPKVDKKKLIKDKQAIVNGDNIVLK
jgi:hypothetical protein